MVLHIGNALVTTTPERVLSGLVSLQDGILVNGSPDTTIYIDLNHDNLITSGGGYALLPGKDVPLNLVAGYDGDLWAVVRVGVSAILSWIITTKG